MASVGELILDTVGWLVVPIIGYLVLAEVFDSGTTVIEVHSVSKVEKTVLSWGISYFFG